MLQIENGFLGHGANGRSQRQWPHLVVHTQKDNTQRKLSLIDKDLCTWMHDHEKASEDCSKFYISASND